LQILFPKLIDPLYYITLIVGSNGKEIGFHSLTNGKYSYCERFTLFLLVEEIYPLKWVHLAVLKVASEFKPKTTTKLFKGCAFSILSKLFLMLWY